MHIPKLQSERLRLRPIVAADHAHIFAGLSHPDVIQFYGVSFLTYEETQVQMDWYATLQQEETGCWWAICDRETGTFLGAGGLNDLSKEHLKAEIGFWLLPQYWGKGFMKEAFPLILDHSFNDLGLHRIEGFVDAHNHNCKRALAKVGFTQEGTMRDCEMKNGALISIDIYSRLKGEQT